MVASRIPLERTSAQVNDPSVFLIMLGSVGVWHLPLIIIAIVGIVLAGRRVADNPRAARRARAGCIVLLLGELTSILQPFLYLRPTGGGFSLMGAAAAVSLLATVLVSVAVGLLVGAAVARRPSGSEAQGVAGFGAPGLLGQATTTGPGPGPTVTPWGPSTPPGPDFGTPPVISSR
jgi:hypothetical protein